MKNSALIGISLLIVVCSVTAYLHIKLNTFTEAELEEKLPELTATLAEDPGLKNVYFTTQEGYRGGYMVWGNVPSKSHWDQLRKLLSERHPEFGFGVNVRIGRPYTPATSN